MIIKQEQFAGPLSLLLQMIEQEKMAITEVNLAKITDEYVTYIKNSPNITADNIADFLVVAAKLLLIKSKALLPYLSQEEEAEIEEFQEQLKMYQEFLQATKHIAQLANSSDLMFAREFDRQALLSSNQIFFPPSKLSLEHLPAIFDEVLGRLVAPAILEEETIMDEVNIDDRIAFIAQVLTSKLKLVFSHIIKGAKDKTDIIVSFLAILELMKQRDINIEQSELFGEIEINKL